MSVARHRKPKKPKGFPLTPHSNGQWVKKLKGRSYYFGSWDDPAAALEQYNHDWPYLLKGQDPPPQGAGDAPTVEYICNAYLHFRRGHVDTNELSLRSWYEFKRVAEFVCKHFGKQRPVSTLGPADFTKLHREAKRKWGGTRISNFVNYTKTMFRRASDALELIEQEPKYGYVFKGMSQAEKRQIKMMRGPLMFEPEDARKIVEACNKPMKAMVLLGLNAAFNNIDCARLPLQAVNLTKAFINFPRAKAHTQRRVMLWPETIEALELVIHNEKRPIVKDRINENLVFITRYGQQWITHNEHLGEDGRKRARYDDAIAKEFRKVLDLLGIHRRGLGFSALRKTFRTFADEIGDQPAVNLVMGHISSDMGDWYVQRIGDERLWRVVNHVRDRLGFQKT